MSDQKEFERIYEEVDKLSEFEQLDGIEVLSSNETLDNIRINDSTV